MPKTIAYSGAQGTGKTTAAHQQVVDIKQSMTGDQLNVYFLGEFAEKCPFPINREATEETQSWLFHSQIKAELEARARFDIVVQDRTIIDVIAYTLVAGFTSLADAMTAYAAHHINYYDVVYVKTIEANQYCYPDGIRDVDPSYRKDVQQAIFSLYDALADPDTYPGAVYHV